MFVPILKFKLENKTFNFFVFALGYLLNAVKKLSGIIKIHSSRLVYLYRMQQKIRLIMSKNNLVLDNT